jgi:GNAT superfamily N-acetyltransferase
MPMPTVLHHENPPSIQESQQIIELVAANLTELSMQGIQPSNPLYEVYSWGLSAEIAQYLHGIGQRPDVPVELIVAYDDDNPEQVLGFVLYLPLASNPEACGITYMAVHQSHRQRGLGSTMMREVIRRYPHVALTCFVNKVPFYERLGFQVLSSKDTQVSMNTRSSISKGLMGVVDAELIYQAPEVRQIHAQLVRRWGVKEMKNAEKRLQRHVDQLTRKAATYVHERLSVELETA